MLLGTHTRVHTLTHVFDAREAVNEVQHGPVGRPLCAPQLGLVRHAPQPHVHRQELKPGPPCRGAVQALQLLMRQRVDIVTA